MSERSEGPDVAAAPVWMGEVTASDRRVLARCLAPVLDAGCGPGRHAQALSERGIPTLGVDISEHLLHLARAKGAPVLQRSVFERLPATGRWGTVLLLDGNLGIGGDPVVLLRRVGALIRPGGRVIVEFEAPGRGMARRVARVELDGRAGPWFGWAQIGACQAQALVDRSGLQLTDLWEDDARWFAVLERRAPS